MQVFTTQNPGYIIFVLDQSCSMGQPYCNGQSLSEFASLFINRTINELINSNMNGEHVYDRIFISIIGYGANNDLYIDEIRSDYLSEFADTPLRIEKIKKKVSDGGGGLVEIEEQMPIFIDPTYNKRNVTNSGKGMEYCINLINQFQRKHIGSTPIINHITGGYPIDFENFILHSRNIKDKNRIVINTLLSQNSLNEFPNILDTLESGFQESIFYESSSYIPKNSKNSFNKFGFNIKKNAKLVTTNINSICMLFDFGS